MDAFRTKIVHLKEAKIAEGMWGEKYWHKLDVCRATCETSRPQADVSVSTGRVGECLGKLSIGK